MLPCHAKYWCARRKSRARSSKVKSVSQSEEQASAQPAHLPLNTGAYMDESINHIFTVYVSLLYWMPSLCHHAWHEALVLPAVHGMGLMLDGQRRSPSWSHLVHVSVVLLAASPPRVTLLAGLKLTASIPHLVSPLALGSSPKQCAGQISRLHTPLAVHLCNTLAMPCCIGMLVIC